MHQVLIYQNLPKKVDLASLKSNVDKLNIDKLKNVPSNFSNLKNKVNKLPVPTDLNKLRDVVKNDAKKMYIMLRSKILKIKYLILIT